MKKFMYVFLGVVSALILIFILNFQVIMSKINDDPGNYLVQIICMLIPLSVTFYFYYISLRQRETDEKDRRKNNDKQQLIYNKILERLEKQNIQLEKQNIQQEKIAEYMEKTAIELRRTRRPEGIVFIYKNYRLLKEYVNLSDGVENTWNVVARITALENIYKEWNEIDDEEVLLEFLDSFSNARYFLKQYIALLHLSLNILIDYEKEKKNITANDDFFHLGLNKPISILELISNSLLIANKTSENRLKKIIENENISHIDSMSQFSFYMSVYSDSDESQIKEKIEAEFIEFNKNIELSQSTVMY